MPTISKKIDNLLSQTKQLSKEQLSEIKKLRDGGHKAHKEGDHAESVKILKQAPQTVRRLKPNVSKNKRYRAKF